MEDAEVTLAKAGIHEGGSQPRLKRVRGFTCEVCYDDETKETLALNCDHRCKSSPFSLHLPLSNGRRLMKLNGAYSLQRVLLSLHSE